MKNITVKKWIRVFGILALASATLLAAFACRGNTSDTSAQGGAAAGKDTAAKSQGGAQAEEKLYHCAMHPWYIAHAPGHCPICGMELVPFIQEKGGNGVPGNGGAAGSGSTGGGAAIVQVDSASIQKIGVKTQKVGRRDLRGEVRASGKIKVEENRVTIVNSRVTGYAEKLHANTTGQRVRKGETLLDIYSPDLSSAQEEYLQALRYARGPGNNAVTGSQDLVESSRLRLLNWGVPSLVVDALARDGKVRHTLPIASPASGIILEKMVNEGQSIGMGMELYKLADLSRVWVVAYVYQRDLPLLSTGSRAEVEMDYAGRKPIPGRVTFISPVLDEASRTAEIRVEVANTPAMDLKPEMFATVHFQGAVHQGVIAVPDQAIIRSGRRNLAVIALGAGYFQPREVTLGTSADGYVEILSGIEEGDDLVVSSQFLIDSESNLRAAVQKLTTMNPAGENAGAAADGAPMNKPGMGNSAGQGNMADTAGKH